MQKYRVPSQIIYPPTFLQYTKDYMLGYSWEWTYSKMYDGKYTIIQMDDPAMKEVPFEDRFGMLVDVESIATVKTIV